MEGSYLEMVATQRRAGCERQPAVYVRSAYKQYGNHCVLKGLNMTVHPGSIYGLLGSSGAGKTTLLTCVVGQRALDAGEIRVLGSVPRCGSSSVPGRKIGYMPQDIALYSNFSVKDTALYFGWLFNMSTREILERLDFLMKLLDLPPHGKMVKNMSGGQQRRLSLAVALLHDPEVLILDEPTVGVDPLLRQAVWDHLVDLARGGKAVIMTTHYIEEAREADTIGLMRNGYLLEEASPDALLEKYSCDSLEQVFLHCSKEQDAKMGSTTGMRTQGSDNVNRADPHLLFSEEKSISSMLDRIKLQGGLKKKDVITTTKRLWMGRMRALLFKNSLSIIRDPGLVAFVFGQAVMLIAVCHMVLGNLPQNLPLAVVNQDISSPSASCMGVVPTANCSLSDLACQFLLHLHGPVLHKEFYDHLDSAKEAVRRGHAWGALYISENFTQAVQQRQELWSTVNEKVLEGSSIRVWLDMSNQIISWMIYEELKAEYLNFARGMLAACDFSPKLADVPIRILEPVYGSMTTSFMNFAAPGLMLFMIFFFGVALSVLSIVYERRGGLLDRNFIAGVTMAEVMVAHFVTQLLLTVGQVVLFIVFAFYVFHFECVGSMMWVFAIIMLQGISGMCYGFVISSVCRDEGTAFHFASASMQPMIFLCGTVWPFEGMSPVIRWLSELMPLTHPVKALHLVMMRGWGPDHAEVSTGLGLSTVWIAVYLAATLIISRVARF